MRSVFKLIIVLLFITACSSTKTVINTNFAPLYSYSNIFLRPQFLINHINDSITRVYYKIEGQDIIDSDNIFQITIKATTHESIENPVIIDSISIMNIDSIHSNQHILGSFDINTGKTTTSTLSLTTKNILAGTTNYKLVKIDKSKNNLEQHFITKEQKQPIFDNIVSSNEVEINHNLTNKELIVKYYNYNSKLPSPPFSTSIPLPFDEEPSEVYLVTSINNKVIINTEKEGIYFITDSENSTIGYTLYNFGNDFPKITNIKSVIEPMRYITSKKEYNHLTSFEDSTQYYFEEFWLNCSSTPEKAKELISNYYKRIEASNYYFSSYAPGWKTDRGIIYLIFGPPSAVRIKENKESWTYGEEGNYMSVNFVFIKENNPFSNNHYVLNRSSIYKSHWYRAVDNWRQGKIPTN